MSKTNKRVISAVLCAAILLTTAVILSVRDTRAAEYPLIYCNDEAWWLDSLATVEYSDDEEFVPIDIFTRLPSIETTMNFEKGSYMLRNTESGEYISISSYSKMALHNGTSMFRLACYERPGKYYTYFYIPLDRIAPLVGCSIEHYAAASGRVYVRVCDGGEKLSFEELLKKYVPDEFPEESTTERPTETVPPASETEPPVVPEVEKNIYLSFDGISAHTAGILDVLASYGKHATFFLSSDDIREHPATAVRIFAEGHAIGVTPDGGSPDEVSRELSAMLAINSRIVRSDEPCDEPSFAFENGYLIVGGELTVDDSLSPASLLSVLQLHISKSADVLISLPSSADSTQLVRLLLEFYSSDGHVSFSKLGVLECRGSDIQ